MSGWGLGDWGDSDFGWGGVTLQTGSGSVVSARAETTAVTLLPPYARGILISGFVEIDDQAGIAIKDEPSTYFSAQWDVSDLLWQFIDVTWEFETILFSQPAQTSNVVSHAGWGTITAGSVFVLNSYPGTDIGLGSLLASNAVIYPDTPYPISWDAAAAEWSPDYLTWGGGEAFVYSSVTGTITAQRAVTTAVTEKRVMGEGQLTVDPSGYSGVAAALRSSSGFLQLSDASVAGVATRWVFGAGTLHASPACGFTYWIRFNKSARNTWTPVDDRQPNVCSGDNNA